VAFAPDGSILASSVNDATVRLWDPRTGTQLETLSHPSPVPAIAWSPDGRLLASGDVQGDIRLWRVQKHGPARCEQMLAGHSTWVDGLAFAPDGSTLASASWDGTIKLWDTSTALSAGVASGHLRQTLAGHTDQVSRVAWSPDGTRLASGSRGSAGSELFVWDAQRGERLRAFTGHPGIIYAVAWGSSEDLVISGGGNGNLRWWDVRSGECVRVREAHQGTVQRSGAVRMGESWRAVAMMGRSCSGICIAASISKPCGVTAPTNAWILPGLPASPRRSAPRS
jgi:WD40 repeat protein